MKCIFGENKFLDIECLPLEDIQVRKSWLDAKKIEKKISFGEKSNLLSKTNNSTNDLKNIYSLFIRG